ncbi:15472_t:CDS:2 [Acaulospora colombiana]|uniref:15472_t:CDS:1 n=1 Tax=Acaulospora colombiana TaxID=27376 RepID=A0ACA9KEY1_9GLOM|nr:15472_t:CDS:2 [Acaulospora colombiana]
MIDIRGDKKSNKRDDDDLQNFLTTYVNWLKSSDACIHLFLAYLRERACSSTLPPRLDILLDGYVNFRKRACESVSVFHHPLADITVADVGMIVRPDKTNYLESAAIVEPRQSNLGGKMDRNDDTSDGETNSNKNSPTISETCPETIESLNTLKRCTSFGSRTSADATVDDPRTAAQKFGELMTQHEGAGVISEELLGLLFEYDDRRSDRDSKNVGSTGKVSGQNSRVELISEIANDNDRTFDPEEVDMDARYSGGLLIDLIEEGNMLERNDSGCSMRATVSWGEFEKLGFWNLVDNKSNESFSLTIKPVSDYDEPCANESNERPDGRPKTREVIKPTTVHRKKFRFLCIKRRLHSGNSKSSVSENVNHSFIADKEDWEDWYVIDQFPYALVELGGGETGPLNEWVLVEPRKEPTNDCEWVVSEKEKRERGSFHIPWIKSNRLSNGNNNKEKVKLLVIHNKDDMVNGVSITPTKYHHQQQRNQFGKYLGHQQQQFDTTEKYITTEITATQTSYLVTTLSHPSEMQSGSAHITEHDDEIAEEATMDSGSEYDVDSQTNDLRTDDDYQPDEIYSSYINDNYSVSGSFCGEKNTEEEPPMTDEYPETIAQDLPWPPTNYPPPPQDYSKYYKSSKQHDSSYVLSASLNHLSRYSLSSQTSNGGTSYPLIEYDGYGNDDQRMSYTTDTPDGVDQQSSSHDGDDDENSWALDSSYVTESRRVLSPQVPPEPLFYARYRNYYMPTDDQTSYPRPMIVNHPYRPPTENKEKGKGNLIRKLSRKK